MARIVFTMASGREYSTLEITDVEARSLANTAATNATEKLTFISTGNENILLNPLQVESIKFYEDEE